MLINNLRPHHLLCISFFEGKGYSPEFIDNMIKVINRLERASLIRLIVATDSICSCCPHNQDSKCSSESKVNYYDKTVLSICKLQEGQLLNFHKLKELVDTQIIRAERLAAVCGDCQWYTICQGKADQRYSKKQAVIE